MNSKLKNLLLLWSIVGVIMGCQQKGKITRTLKKRTAVETIKSKADPSAIDPTSPNNAQSILVNFKEDASSQVSIPISVLSTTSAPSASCSSTFLSYSSSDVSLVAAQNAVTWGGVWPNCTAVISPVENANGSSIIEITAHEGATSLIVKSVTIVSEPVNDAPSISDVVSQSTNEDIPTNSLSVTISDVDSSLDCATDLSASSSNTTLLPNANITIGGSAPNCTVILNPILNQFGTSTVTLTVTDGLLSAQDSFVLTVNAVNDAPTMASISTPQITSEDNNLGVAFTVSDVDGALTCSAANLLYSSDAASIVATSGAVTWSGTWPNCTGTISPVANANGSANVTFAITDGTLSSSRIFMLTATAVNDAPFISDVVNQSTIEDTDLNNLPVTISDVDNTLVCATALSATSSNTTLLPNANITIGGSAPNCTVSLTPAANQNSASTVTLTVTDGLLSAQDTFVLTVNAINDAPIISDVANQSTNQDTVLSSVPVTITDIDSSLTCSNITAISSNTTLILSASIIITGTTPNCLMSLSPASGQIGSSTVTLTVSDGALTATDTFVFTVTKADWNQEAYFKASNSDANDRFGYSVAISGDTAVIGAYLEGSSQTTITNGSTSSANNSVSFSGASYIYKRTSSSWAQEAYIKASNTDFSDAFGWTVALSSNTALIGAYGEDSNQTTITNGTASTANNSSGNAGAVYIYRRTGATWVQEAFLKASNAGTGDSFGKSVALSGDTAVIGATEEDANQITITNGTTSSTDNTSTDTGASYIYKRTGSTWAQEAYLKASNANPSDKFGYSVALSGDTAVIGAYLEDSNETTISNGTTSSTLNAAGDAGTSYIYRRTGSTWTQEAYLKASNAEGSDYFGYSVSISGDTAIVGAYQEDSNQTTIANGTTSSTDNLATDAGASYIYRRTGSTWAQEAYIKASNADVADYFGYSVALSGDTAVIGAKGECSSQVTITNGTTSSTDNLASSAGASYIYKRTGSTWAQEAYLKASNAGSLYDYFGYSVALSGDTAVIGAQQEDSNQTTITNGTTSSASNTLADSGAVYVYRNLSRLFEAHELQTSVTSSSFTVSWNSSNLGSGNGTFKVVYSTSTPGANCSSGTEAYTGTSTSVSVSSGLTPGQSYIVRICTFNGVSYSEGTTTQVTVKGDDLAPTVLSINRGAASNPVTGISLVDYIVTFNEPVIGVSPDNFSFSEVVTTTGATGQVSSISCSGAICTVWVQVGNAGQLRLDLTSVTGIVDIWGNPLTAGRTGDQTYTLQGWAQVAYLKASNSNANDTFGNSVALSGDTAVIGANGEDSNQTTITNGTTSSADNTVANSGAAYIYKRTGSTWSQEAYIKASNSDASDSYGFAVAISGDTAVVGAYEEASSETTITNGTTSSTNNTASTAGASYIYRRTGSTWAQEAYLKASNAGASDYFGISVALSGDTVAIGAHQEGSNQTTITNGSTSSTDNSASGAGASYIYKKSGSTWVQEAYLKASNSNASDFFGYAVAISGDTTVIGAYFEGSNQTTITNGTTSSANNSAASAGASYIYKKTGSTWAQEAYIKASNANSNDLFGTSVALSGDMAVIGAIRESSNQTTITNGTTSSTNNTAVNAGASYIYRRTGATWAQEAYIKASNADATDFLGISVAISGDTAVIGASRESSSQAMITNATTSSTDNLASWAGASYIYKRIGSTWAQEAYLKASNAGSLYDYFGYSVALSGDTAVIGANGEDSNQTTITNGTTSSASNTLADSGAVYVYRNPSRLFDPELRVSAKTTTSITLSWGINLGNTTQVKIAPAVLGTGSPLPCTDGGAITLGAGVTSYTYSGLTSATAYGFRVCGFDGTNIGDGSVIRDDTN